MPAHLSQLPCKRLRGVGDQLSTRLAKLGIYSIQDLLFHLPLRYENRTELTPIGEVRSGDHVVVEGTIIDVKLHQGRRASLLCALKDSTGILTLRFFHFTNSQKNQLARQGLRIRCFGEIREGFLSGFEMVHPEYRYVNANTPQPLETQLTPIYPTTEGLNQVSFRKLMEQALDLLNQNILLEDYLPETLLKEFNLPDLASAIHYVHRPPADTSRTLLEKNSHPSQKRLAFEELLAHQLSLQQRRLHLQHYKSPILHDKNTLISLFLANLPFSLTQAQQRVIAEIQGDLQRDVPMLRLVQGDVGSGKTIVAAVAILQAVSSGYQATLMAPTELLAEQHYKNFTQWLQPLGIQVTFLASSLKPTDRIKALEGLKNGEISIAIGTHALFQKDVYFNCLGLVVIDEQHRFGVHQRLELQEKGNHNNLHPHQLIMTATPIPRTLTMTAYADLDCSTIDELPPGRKPVTTVVISNQRRQEIIEKLNTICQTGTQAYWVCTLIEESDVLQCEAAEATAAFLTKQLPQLRLDLIHGRLRSREKEEKMAAFKAGHTQLLIATTVIEVGVDVPNASLMIIENAERLGLAQLHQLRGRVGRGSAASHCVLLHQNPLSFQARQRLAVIKNSHDGFEIAQKDLEIRGPGDVLGTRQAGLMQFRIADLIRDKALLLDVQKASQQLLQTSPHSVTPLIERWTMESGKYRHV